MKNILGLLLVFVLMLCASDLSAQVKPSGNPPKKVKSHKHKERYNKQGQKLISLSASDETCETCFRLGMECDSVQVLVGEEETDELICEDCNAFKKNTGIQMEASM